MPVIHLPAFALNFIVNIVSTMFTINENEFEIIMIQSFFKIP